MGSSKETSFCHCHPSSAHPSASASDVSEVRSALVVVVILQIAPASGVTVLPFCGMKRSWQHNRKR